MKSSNKNCHFHSICIIHRDFTYAISFIFISILPTTLGVSEIKDKSFLFLPSRLQSMGDTNMFISNHKTRMNGTKCHSVCVGGFLTNGNGE